MASGWWKSTHANLALGSPANFTVTTAPSAPRNWGKIASVCASGGFYMGGTPCVSVGDVIYYAGETYTQNTDNPPLYRYDGRVSTKVLETPYVTGTTPSKAILSIITDDEQDCLFISTWDSGTTSADFAGRIYAYQLSDGTTTRIDGGLFTTGKLPYALVWFNSALYVGVSKQNPTSTTEVIKLPTAGGLPGGPGSPAAVLTGTSYSYEVGGLNGTPSFGTFINHSNTVTVKNRASLNSSFYNTLTWNDPGGGTLSYRVTQPAAVNVIADIASNSTVTYDDQGVDSSAGSYSSSGSQAITLAVTPVPAQTTTTTYYITAVLNGFEFISNAVTLSAPATLYSDLYVALSWSAVSGATSYKVYRSAGGGSTGLISTTASLSLNDTGLAATGSVPEVYSTVALTSGAAACAVVYNSNLYIGSNQPAATFGKVFKLTTGGVLTTSQTEAPGGTAGAYNGFTAGIVWNSNLYMSYWNDDATDVLLIKKYTGSAWSTVKTITGASAAPGLMFCEADSKLWFYGGGDAKNGILYSTTDGTTWTNQSALLPSAKEGVPFMGNANVLGGF